MEAPPAFTVECAHQLPAVLHHLEHSGCRVLIVLEVSCRLWLVRVCRHGGRMKGNVSLYVCVHARTHGVHVCESLCRCVCAGV